MQEDSQVQCPHCFEVIEITIDVSGGKNQEYVIDCEVCCRPMTLRVEVQPDSIWIDAQAS